MVAVVVVCERVYSVCVLWCVCVCMVCVCVVVCACSNQPKQCYKVVA